MRRLTITSLITCLLCVVPVPHVTAQSPAPPSEAPVLGSGDEALAWLTSMGSGEVEVVAAADGQLRWEATLPMSDVVVEIVGSPEALTSASLTATTGSESYPGYVIVPFVQQFHPESLGFVVNALLRGAFVDELDAEAELAGGTVLVSTVRVVDASDGDETMSIVITLED